MASKYNLFSLFLIMLFIGQNVHGQDQNEIDSLKTELIKKGISDSLKGEILQEIGSKYIYTKLDSFMYYSRLSLHEFNKAKHEKGILRALVNIGNNHTNFNNLDSAQHYFSLVKERVDEDDFETLVFLYFNYAFLHHNYTNDYQEAINNYFIAIDYAAKLKDTTKLAVFHYNIADLFGQNGMRNKAYPHNKKAYTFAQRSNLDALKPIVLYGIGVYHFEGENYDSSMYYYEESLKLTDTKKDFNSAYYAYNGISESHFGRKEYEHAYTNALKANQFANLIGTDYEIAMSLCKLSACALMTDRKKESSESWANFVAINDTIQNNYLGEICYRLRSESLADKKVYDEAFHLMQNYVELKDSTFSRENRAIISELETKYETNKKELEIEKQQLIIEKEQTHRNAILGGSGLLFLLATIAIWALLQRTKKNRLLFEQSNVIQSQKISQLEKEKKLLAMNAMLEGQEAERMRIAKDLHDGLGGLLSTVKARLTNINTEVKKIESYNIYEKTTSMVDEACDEVRRISHNLLPGALRLDGLKTAIEQLGEDLSKSHPFHVNLEVIGFEIKLDETKEIFLYRIVQEAMNNIIKHANAKEVLIQLSETEHEYHIIIEDDGVGFDASTESRGLGLKSMRSRIEHLQGELDISSKLNQGTTISIHIPKLKI